MLKDVVSGNEVGLAVEFNEGGFVVVLGEGEETFGSGARGFLGGQNLAPLPELFLSGIHVPIGIHQSRFHVLDGGACPFSQLLYQIHFVCRRRGRGIGIVVALIPTGSSRSSELRTNTSGRSIETHTRTRTESESGECREQLDLGLGGEEQNDGYSTMSQLHTTRHGQGFQTGTGHGAIL